MTRRGFTRNNLAGWLACATLVVGCSKTEAGGAPTAGDDTSAETSAETGGTGMESATESATGGVDDTATSGEFIIEPDIPQGVECDVWAQDCPEGEKCAPWANDGGGSWNATKCVPLDDAPKQPGDACTVEGSGVSGFDDCDVASMCWNVDGETNMGTCVAFCSGSEANGVCENPSTTCVIANDGVLILCLPVCDPLLQDCSNGEACYPADADFVCAPDASGPDLGFYNDACEFTNACDPGLFCADASLVPSCQGSRCCSEYCDFDDPDAGMNCSGAAGGQECVSWWADNEAPPGLEHVGACAIPG